MLGYLSHIGDDARPKFSGRTGKIVKEFRFGGGWVLSRWAGRDGGAESGTEVISAVGEGTGVREILEELLTAAGIDGVTVCLLEICTGKAEKRGVV